MLITQLSEGLRCIKTGTQTVFDFRERAPKGYRFALK